MAVYDIERDHSLPVGGSGVVKAAGVPLLLAVSILASACASPTSPGVDTGIVSVNGTILYFNLEGGFWAVRGDDGVVYQPMDGLGSQFRRENLRVAMTAKVRNDLGGIHMVGPIVEIVSIRLRELSTGFPVVDPRRGPRN